MYRLSHIKTASHTKERANTNRAEALDRRKQNYPHRAPHIEWEEDANLKTYSPLRQPPASVREGVGKYVGTQD